MPRRLTLLVAVCLAGLTAGRTPQLGDSDLTLEDAAVASPLAELLAPLPPQPRRGVRHKRQSFWDTWSDTEDIDTDYYDEFKEYYNRGYGDFHDYSDVGGGTTVSGDGLPEPPVPTDDEDMIEGSGPPGVSPGVGPRMSPRPTPPVPTAPAGLVYYRLTLTVEEACQPVEQTDWLKSGVEELFQNTVGLQVANVIQASPGYVASTCDYMVDLTSQAFDNETEFERLLGNARDKREIGGRPFIDFQMRRFGAPASPGTSQDSSVDVPSTSCHKTVCGKVTPTVSSGPSDDAQRAQEYHETRMALLRIEHNLRVENMRQDATFRKEEHDMKMMILHDLRARVSRPAEGSSGLQEVANVFEYL